MKFIVDANLPGSLSKWLNDKGFDSLHTLDLENKNRTPDEFLFKLSIEENRVIITKDHDFLKERFVNNEMFKVLFISTGNLSNKKLIQLFDSNLIKIINLIAENKVIELSLNSIIVHY